VPTRLCTHNKEADQVNRVKLDALPGMAKVFKAVDNPNGPNIGFRSMLFRVTDVCRHVIKQNIEQDHTLQRRLAAQERGTGMQLLSHALLWCS
jgi:hypothetical protein